MYSSARKDVVEEANQGKRTKVRWSKWARTALVTLCLILSSSSSYVSSVQFASAHGFRRESFHCYRPFDSLDSFKLEAMKPEDNCRLDYQRVVDAAVRVDCYRHGQHYAYATSGNEAIHGRLSDRFGRLPSPSGVPVSNGGSDRPDVIAKNPPDDRSGCYATMLIKAVRDDGFSGRGSVSNDRARYGVKLHTRGGGVVHYKGMNGEGYSVCCMFLNQPDHSRCEWRNVTIRAHSAGDEEHETRLEQVVEYCDVQTSHRPSVLDNKKEANEKEPANNNETDVPSEDEDPLGILGNLKSDENGEVNKVTEQHSVTDGAVEYDSEDAFVGYVTKPLHRNMPGTWTMEVLFFRGQDAVGKIVSDFTVTKEMLEPPQRLHRTIETEAGVKADKAKEDLDGASEEKDIAAAVAIVPVADDPSAEENKGESARKKKKGKRRRSHKDD